MYPSSCQTVRNRSQSAESRQRTQFSINSRIESLSSMPSLSMVPLHRNYAVALLLRVSSSHRPVASLPVSAQTGPCMAPHKTRQTQNCLHVTEESQFFPILIVTHHPAPVNAILLLS